MIYQPLGISLTEIQAEQENRYGALSAPGFQWRSEYLPFIIAFGGLLSIGLIRKMRKSKKGKKVKV